MSNLGPSHQVPEPTVLAEVVDRSMRHYSARRSATFWLCRILVLLRSTFRYPRTMGSLKRFRASSRANRCSSIDRGRYAPTSGVHMSHMTSLHLTTFVPW